VPAADLAPDLDVERLEGTDDLQDLPVQVGDLDIGPDVAGGPASPNRTRKWNSFSGGRRIGMISRVVVIRQPSALNVTPSLRTPAPSFLAFWSAVRRAGTRPSRAILSRFRLAAPGAGDR
jgi:hypothetical protein